MELVLLPQPMHFSASPYPTIILIPFLPGLSQQVSSLLLLQHPVKRNKFMMYCIRYDCEQIFSHLGSFWFSRNGGTHVWDSEFEIGNCRRKIPLPIISLALFFVTNSTFYIIFILDQCILCFILLLRKYFIVEIYTDFLLSFTFLYL